MSLYIYWASVGMGLAIAMAVTALVVLVSGPYLIPKLHSLKYGQSIRDEGPASHQKKSGTPTMGGLMMIPAITIGTLVLDGFQPEALLAIFVMLGHFAIGFADDYIKVVKKRNLGLTAKQKLLAQIIMAAVVIYIGHNYLGLKTTVWIPVADVVCDLGSLYYAFVLCVLVGTTNAVNLTDGLDGLASGTVAVAAAAYSIISFVTGHEDLVYFSAAVSAACLAFLVFNHHPAKIFMGDTGSLALGGALAAVAILTQTELLLVIVGAVFVAEAMSVMMQVTYFKLTGGKRIFRMSPLHHHYELGGWSETRVVYTFWTAGAIFAALALALIVK